MALPLSVGRIIGIDAQRGTALVSRHTVGGQTLGLGAAQTAILRREVDPKFFDQLRKGMMVDGYVPHQSLDDARRGAIPEMTDARIQRGYVDHFYSKLL